MVKTYEFEFDAPPEQLYTETVSAVSALGFSILRSEDAASSLTFNTGPSIWSTAGQDMTVRALPLSPQASKLVITGRTARRGKHPEYGSWGERGRIAKGLATRVRSTLTDRLDAPAFVDELAHLADLHRSGDITSEEFERAKDLLFGA